MKTSYLQYKITELEQAIREEWPDNEYPEETRGLLEILQDIETEVQARKL